MKWHLQSKYNSLNEGGGTKRGREGGMREEMREEERGWGKRDGEMEERGKERGGKEGRPKIQGLQGLEEGKRWRQCARPLCVEIVVAVANDMVLRALTNAHGGEIRFEGGLGCCCFDFFLV